MYGGVIWLSNNLNIFESLWNDALLKCSGSMFYTHKELTELLLQLPPLDVQLEIITVKFLCKCIVSQDMMSNIIQQIDGCLGNHLHHQLTSLKDFLAWKLGLRSGRHIDLGSRNILEAAKYSESDIELYTKKIWLNKIYNRCIIKNRSTTHDSVICEAINREIILLSKKTYIFGHGTTRYMDSRICDFIHGSSTAFANFSVTLGTQECSICRYCKTDPDSPEHQLFYCTALEDPTRQKLLTVIDDPTHYIVDLVFAGCGQIHKLFYDRIAFIDSINVE